MINKIFDFFRDPLMWIILFPIKLTSMMTKLIWELLYYSIFSMWILVKWSLWSLWWCISVIYHLFFPKPKPKPCPIIEELPELEEIFPIVKEEVQEPISRIGNITPQEQDHDLRTFKITNSEGEIYRINTAVEGPFYGPVWTRILSCYETQQVIHGRLLRPYYDKNNSPIGFYVKIENITAFLPTNHAMRALHQKPINIPLAILNIDPSNNKITVSSKVAYKRVLADIPPPKAKQQSKCIYWDYDESEVYLLLPGNYMGVSQHKRHPEELARSMGKLTECYIKEIDSASREAKVTIFEGEYHEAI